MKRILLITMLIAGGATEALAQEAPAPPLAPPSGTIQQPADPYGQPQGPYAQGPRGQRGQRGQRGGRHGQRRQRLRAALLARFDRNRDGRLTGPEKIAAKRFVMRMRARRQMMRGQRDF